MVLVLQFCLFERRILAVVAGAVVLTHDPQLCRFACSKHCEPERKAEGPFFHAADCGGDETYWVTADILVEQVEVDISLCQK